MLHMKRPYNKEHWQQTANTLLMDKSMPSSALESAYIALRRDDPTLAELCKEEAKRRRRWEYTDNKKAQG